MKKKKEKRVEHINFDKHEVYVTEKDGLLIHHLKEPGTIMCNVKFINTNDVLLVTGDFGNWVFCREFHPSANGSVSDDYWLEKLTINTVQEGKEFDSEATAKEIEEGINGGLKEYGYEGEKLEEIISYYKDILYYSDTEWEYVGRAYGNMPGFMDAESVPNIKKIKTRLQIVFDAFEEICYRMKKEEECKKNRYKGKFKFGDSEIKCDFVFDFGKLQKLLTPYDCITVKATGSVITMTRDTEFELHNLGEKNAKQLALFEDAMNCRGGNLNQDCYFENEYFIFDIKKALVTTVSWADLNHDNIACTDIQAILQAHMIELTIKDIKKTPIKISIKTDF